MLSPGQIHAELCSTQQRLDQREDLHTAEKTSRQIRTVTTNIDKQHKKNTFFSHLFLAFKLEHKSET